MGEGGRGKWGGQLQRDSQYGHLYQLLEIILSGNLQASLLLM